MTHSNIDAQMLEYRKTISKLRKEVLTLKKENENMSIQLYDVKRKITNQLKIMDTRKLGLKLMNKVSAEPEQEFCEYVRDLFGKIKPSKILKSVKENSKEK